MALEKQCKLTLNQEVEAVKDRFVELEKVMTRFEMGENLEKAANFLTDQSHLAYYSVLACLGQLADKYQGQKEGAELAAVISNMSHYDDVKVTFTNGFHVNTAVTSRVWLDDNAAARDNRNYFKCVQPVIDEKAQIPSPFSLVEGLFTQGQVNLLTYKKARAYMGQLPLRDYQTLDVRNF